MKVGDLVRLKRAVFSPNRPDGPARGYSDDPGLVFGVAGKGIKVLMPDGKVKVGLADHWDVIQEVEG